MTSEEGPNTISIVLLYPGPSHDTVTVCMEKFVSLSEFDGLVSDPLAFHTKISETDNPNFITTIANRCEANYCRIIFDQFLIPICARTSARIFGNR